MYAAIRGWLSAGALAVALSAQVAAAPFQLQRMSSWPGYARGPAYDVQVVGTNAFLRLENGALAVLDVTNLKQPRRVNGYDTLGSAQGLHIAGQFAYLASGTNIKIFDMANAPPPQLIATAQSQDFAWDVYVAGQYLYAMGNYLVIFDISNPARPEMVYEALVNPFHGGVVGVQFLGNRLFVLEADAFTGKSHLQIHEGAIPSYFPLGTIEFDGGASALRVVGNYAFIAGDFGLQIYGIADPQNIALVGSENSGGAARDLLVDGSYCYLANTLGLQLINIASPQMPSPRGSLPTGGAAWRLSKAAIYVYVADLYEGLQIVDVGNPNSLSRVGAYFTAGSVAKVKLSGDYAYLASIQAGLEIIDIRQDDHFIRVGELRTPEIARGLDVSGSFAYVAVNYAGLQIVDVSDPTKPMLSRTIPVPSGEFITDVTLHGAVAYALLHYGGIQVFDLSNATNPVHITTVSNLNRGNVPNSFKVQGDRGFLADSALGLRIFDLSTPTNPVPLGSWTNQWYSRDVAISGNYACMAGDRGVYILDVSDPMNPQPVASYATERLANGIAMSGSNAYVACTSGGLKLLDLADPANPSLVTTILSGESANSVTLSGNRIYVAQGSLGITLLAQITPATIQMMRATPDFAEMSISGTAGFTLKLEASSDLAANWAVLFETNCPATPFIFRDGETSPAHKFYRVHQP